MTSRATLLVVEDNPITRKMVRVALQTEGYEVLEAPNAASAMLLAAAHRPDLILQDIVLPDLNGLQLIRRLRGLPGVADTPILAFTGFLSRLEESQIAAAGFTGLLVKPVQPSQLLEVVRTYLAPHAVVREDVGGGRSVLVVDDDPVQLKLMKIALERMRFRVDAAGDGDEALDRARLAPPDAILSDVLMAGKDGFRLCAAMRSDPDLVGVPIILASSFYIEPEDRELALRLGASDLVSRTPDLLGVLQAVVAAVEAPHSSGSPDRLEDVQGEYGRRLARQLERQLELRVSLAQRSSLQAAALSVLGKISETLTHQVDTEGALRAVLGQCIDAAELSRAAIYLREANGTWRCQSYVGYSSKTTDELSGHFRNGLIPHRFLSEGMPFAIPSVQMSGEPAFDFLASAGASSALIAPIISGGKVLGALLLDSSLKNLGGEEWLAFAKTVSSEIGQALALTRSYAEVARSEERYRALVEHGFDAIVLVDPDGAIRHASQSTGPMLGYDPALLEGDPLRDLVDPDDQGPFEERLREACRTPGEPVRFEFRARHRDGSARQLEAVIVDRLEYPAVGGIVITLRDITERKLGEASLRESEERFRLLADHIKEIFFITDIATGRSIYVSPAYEEIFGRPLAGAYATPGDWLDAVHPDDRDEVRTFASSGEQGVMHFRVLLPNGSIRSIRSRAFPVPGPTGRPERVVGIAEDITELRSVEEQLIQAQKMEAIGRLAGGVAHDFNNILTAILGYSEMILRSLPTQDPISGRCLEIKKAGTRAAHLTAQLLAFSRKQALQPRILELNEHVRQLEGMMRRLLEENMAIEVKPAPDPVHLRADPAQLDQVIINLVVNARDAMPHGGKLRIETGEAELCQAQVHDGVILAAGRYARLRIEDSGEGMDPRTQARIFEPFFTTKEQGKGTGLGLATVYGIVKQSKGHIFVSSQVGRGTAFEVYLPSAPAPGAQPPAEVRAEAPGGDETVLLVEDEEAVRSLAAAALEEKGYRILVAPDGREALRLFEAEKSPIHLLITDVIMPRLGGPELAERLRPLHPEMRVLYVSGYTERADSLREEPGAGFLEKPFTPDSLVRKAREVLELEPPR